LNCVDGFYFGGVNSGYWLCSIECEQL
jgi:hypothetical protein